VSVVWSPGASANELGRGRLSATNAAADPSTAVVAFFTAGHKLRTVPPSGSGRFYAAPAECSGAGSSIFGSGFAVFGGAMVGCAGPEELDLSSGTWSAVPVGRLTDDPATSEQLDVRRVGSQWLEGTMALRSATSPHPLEVPVIVNRRTGQVIDTEGQVGNASAPPTFSSRRYIDLSSTRADQPLCAPVTRLEVSNGRGGTYSGALHKVGRWTLRETSMPSDGLPFSGRSAVQACGSGRVYRLPAGASPVLGNGYLAWLSGRFIRVRKLTNAKTKSVRWYGTKTRSRRSVAFAFSSNRLVVSTRVRSGGAEPYRVHLVRLP